MVEKPKNNFVNNLNYINPVNLETELAESVHEDYYGRRKGDRELTGNPVIDEANKNLYRRLDLETENANLREKNVELEGLRERNIKLEKASLTDLMTGCYNRNYYDKNVDNFFDPDYQEEIKDPYFDIEAKKRQIVLVFIDLNGMKHINDTEGHDAGDMVIKNTAKSLKNNFRVNDNDTTKGDIIIRGGANTKSDEFIIVCRNSDNVEGFEENIIKKIEGIVFPDGVSYAFGTAAYNGDLDKDLNGTLKRAEGRMYELKNKMKLDKSEDINISQKIKLMADYVITSFLKLVNPSSKKS
jgi:diguanylate cyclase (GGDEF)-like protein